MADPKKISEFDQATLIKGSTTIIVVTESSGSLLNEKSTLDFLLANLPSNTAIAGSLQVSGPVTLNGNTMTVGSNATFSGDSVTFDSHVSVANTTGLELNGPYTPASSSITVEKGRIFWDADYIYVATANNNVKRASLASF